MPYFDYAAETSALPTIYPMGSASGTAALVTGTANYHGTAIDLADALGAVVVFTFGNGSGTGSYTLKIEESDTHGTTGFGTAAAADVNFSSSSIGTATDEASVVAGYHGNYRYIRAAVQVSGTPNIPISASIVKFPSVK